MTSIAAPRARPRGLAFLLLFLASFAATLALTRRPPQPSAVQGGDAQVRRSADPAALPASAGTALDRSQPDTVASEKAAASPALPAEQIRQLVDAGINAEDSEQRSLAIEALRNAPVEQSLPALLQVLHESRDTRSRLTAIAELIRLPDTQTVRQVRTPLLERLAGDPDYRIAAAARAAASGDG